MQSWKLLLLLVITAQNLVSAQNGQTECAAVAGSMTTRICNPDCKTMNICGEEGVDFFTVTCSTKTFCSEEVAGAAKCVSDPPAGCESSPEAPAPQPQPPTIEPLVCTGEGFYPDPSDCSTFHYCAGYGERSQFQTCPMDTVFDPEFESSTPCKVLADEAVDCPTVDCSESSVFKSFGSSKKYFAYCREVEGTAEVKVSMFKCGEGTIFDGTQCAFQCVTEGNFANPLSSSTYYQCYYSDEVLIGRMLICPGSRSFNAELGICL